MQPPAWQGSTVGVLGRLVAQGLLPYADILAGLRISAAAVFPLVDQAGRDAEVALSLDESVRAWGVHRDRTRFAIRRALVPMVCARLLSWRLLAEGHSVNEAAGLPLLLLEVDHAVLCEIARDMQRRPAVAQ